jgi:hypothetical protein
MARFTLPRASDPFHASADPLQSGGRSCLTCLDVDKPCVPPWTYSSLAKYTKKEGMADYLLMALLDRGTS